MTFKSTNNSHMFKLAQRKTAMETSGNKRELEAVILLCILVASREVFCPVTFQSPESPNVEQAPHGKEGKASLPWASRFSTSGAPSSSCLVVQTLPHCGIQSCVQGPRAVQMKSHKNKKVNTFCQPPLHIHG